MDESRKALPWRALACLVPALLMGCAPATGGWRGGGGIYSTQWGVESVVPASVERAVSATRQAFDQLRIRQARPGAGQGTDDADTREIDGIAKDRDVRVTLEPEGRGSTRIQVTANWSAVGVDKDFARAVLDKIVAFSR